MTENRGRGLEHEPVARSPLAGFCPLISVLRPLNQCHGMIGTLEMAFIGEPSTTLVL